LFNDNWSGANGFIVVDLPIEEAPVFLAACSKYKLSFVPLLAPTTRPARLQKLVAVADSFVYCVRFALCRFACRSLLAVSVAGVTGERKALPTQLPVFLERVRKATSLPMAVGFGVSTREHFTQVQKLADGSDLRFFILLAHFMH